MLPGPCLKAFIAVCVFGKPFCGKLISHRQLALWMEDSDNLDGRTVQIFSGGSGYPTIGRLAHRNPRMKIPEAYNTTRLGWNHSPASFLNIFNETTGVECPHRELRAGFPDGLRGNDTHSFTDADKHVSRQIVSVAFGADTFLSLAGEH